MRNRWTKEEAWAWYNDQPWVNGCNFIPANTSLKLYYDPATHEESKKLIEKEVKLAADVGINSFRMHRLLPRDVWKNDRDRGMEYLEEFIELLDKYGISLMPVLGNDCVFSKPDENGRSVSCFVGAPVVGWRPDDDMNNWHTGFNLNVGLMIIF